MNQDNKERPLPKNVELVHARWANSREVWGNGNTGVYREMLDDEQAAILASDAQRRAEQELKPRKIGRGFFSLFPR